MHVHVYQGALETGTWKHEYRYDLYTYVRFTVRGSLYVRLLSNVACTDRFQTKLPGTVYDAWRFVSSSRVHCGPCVLSFFSFLFFVVSTMTYPPTCRARGKL